MAGKILWSLRTNAGSKQHAWTDEHFMLIPLTHNTWSRQSNNCR